MPTQKTPRAPRAVRQAAAFADFHASPAGRAPSAIAARAIADRKREAEKRDAMLRDRNLSDVGRRDALAKLASDAAASLAAAEKEIRAHIEDVRRTIAERPPRFEPRDLLAATRINGILHDLDSYDPSTAARVAHEAVAYEDLPLAKRLHDRLGALASWKKPFLDSAEIRDAVAALDELLATDDVVRADAVREWVRRAEVDATYLVTKLRQGPLNDLELELGTLPIFFPPGPAAPLADERPTIPAGDASAFISNISAIADGTMRVEDAA